MCCCVCQSVCQCCLIPSLYCQPVCLKMHIERGIFRCWAGRWRSYRVRNSSRRLAFKRRKKRRALGVCAHALWSVQCACYVSKTCRPWMEEMFICIDKTFNEHLSDLRQVFTRPCQVNLCLKPKKCCMERYATLAMLSLTKESNLTPRRPRKSGCVPTEESVSSLV